MSCICCMRKDLIEILDNASEVPVYNTSTFNINFTKKNKKGYLKCVICQEKITYKSPMYISPCKHKFHAHCIVLHGSISPKCPICRHIMFNFEEPKELINIQRKAINMLDLLSIEDRSTTSSEYEEVN